VGSERVSIRKNENGEPRKRAAPHAVKHRRSLAAARGRDDAVHSEIFDQLTVMIERVSSGECCQEQASGRSATARANRLDKVRRV